MGQSSSSSSSCSSSMSAENISSSSVSSSPSSSEQEKQKATLSPCMQFLHRLGGNWSGHGNIEYEILQAMMGNMSAAVRDIPPGRRTRASIAAQKEQQGQPTAKELAMKIYCSHPDDATVRLNSFSTMKCLSEREAKWVIQRNTAGVEVVTGTVAANGLSAEFGSDGPHGGGVTGADHLARTRYIWNVDGDNGEQARMQCFVERSGLGAKPGLQPWTLMNWSKGHS